MLPWNGSWNCFDRHVLSGSHAEDLGVTAHFAKVLLLRNASHVRMGRALATTLALGFTLR